MMTYRQAIAWIAENDEPTWTDPKDVELQLTTALVSDIYGRETERVAADVIAYRAGNAQGAASSGDCTEPRRA